MRLIGTAAILAATVMVGCGGAEHEAAIAPSSRTAPTLRTETPFTPDEVEVILTFSPLPAPPPDPTNRVADNAAAAHFGQFLFFDPRMSGKGAISCASCHDPDNNWTDGLELPEAFGKDLRHVPSLWNVAYNRWFFWDGRSDSLWAQALDPLEHASEHAGSRHQYARLMYDTPELRQAYEQIFGPMPDMSDVNRFPATAPKPPAAVTIADRDSVNLVFANLGKAIAAYQRRIVSRRAPFDVFVEGLRTGDEAKLRSLSASAQRGLKLFIGRANCRSCHHGPNFTDGEFHNTGVAQINPPAQDDLGRFQGINRILGDPFNALGAYSDDQAGKKNHPTSFLINNVERRGEFKTPTLRNVALTAPYMHRGQIATLEEVIEFYSTLRPPGQDAGAAAAAQAMREARERQRPSGGHVHAGAAEHVLIPIHLSKSEADDLVEFLRSLNDVDIDPALKKAPLSPLQ